MNVIERRLITGWNSKKREYNTISYHDCGRILAKHRKIIKLKPGRDLYDPTLINRIREFLKDEGVSSKGREVFESQIQKKVYEIFIKVYLDLIHDRWFRKSRDSHYSLVNRFDRTFSFSLPTVKIGKLEFTFNKKWMELHKENLIYNSKSSNRFLVNKVDEHIGSFPGGHIFKVSVYKNRDLSVEAAGFLSVDLTKSKKVFSKNLQGAKSRLQSWILDQSAHEIQTPPPF